MKNTILILFILLINFLEAQNQGFNKSIKSKKVNQGKTLSGNLTGFNNGDLIKFYDPEIMKTLDSTYIKEGKFILKNPLGKIPKTIFIIVKSENNYLITILFIAGENITISGNKNDFKFNLKVTGSKFNVEKEDFEKEMKTYKIERDSLQKYFFPKKSDTTKKYLEIQKVKLNRIKEIDKHTNEIELKNIKENINNYYTLHYLSYKFDKLTKSEIQNLYNKLDKEHQQSIYGKQVKTYLQVGKILQAGDIFYDFEAKGQDGKTHKLSEIKNKYILLDFNETYCGPCIESVNELKKIAVDYKDIIEIVSFCADKTKDIWKKGLIRDKPNWLSLWDGKGSKGITPIKYGVDGFPTFILIDKSGKIVKIISGYSDNSIIDAIKENVK